ncbi:MAG: hypothetical protein ACREMV_03470 [Gemmatimonadales bacterium]
MTRLSRAGRTLTTGAVGFLLLDAVLLIYAGLALDRTLLIVLGGVFAIAAAVVVTIAWPRYRRRLDELERARRDMRAEVQSIRDLLQKRHLDN